MNRKLHAYDQDRGNVNSISIYRYNYMVFLLNRDGTHSAITIKVLVSLSHVHNQLKSNWFLCVGFQSPRWTPSLQQRAVCVERHASSSVGGASPRITSMRATRYSWCRDPPPTTVRSARTAPPRSRSCVTLRKSPHRFQILKQQINNAHCLPLSIWMTWIVQFTWFMTLLDFC